MATNIGTGPQDIPLNQFLGEMAFMDNLYKQGTFVATCDNGVTLTGNSDLLQYVKIGNLVTVMGQIQVNSSNGGQGLVINNLPYEIYNAGDASGYATGAVRLYTADMASDHQYVVVITDVGTTNLIFQGVRDNLVSQSLGATDNGYYMFSITYMTS
jgi:hypothetical protein